VTALSTYVGYFDASGKPNDPLVLYVSGFMSTEKKWLKFEKQWWALLNAYGITGPFHTAQYVACNGPDYAQFKKNDPLRDAFEKQAIAIVKQHTLKPFSHGLVLSDYWDMVARYTLPFGFERPYSFCAMQGFYATVKWLRKKKLRIGELVHLVYEDGDDDRDLFSDAMYREVGVRPNFLPKNQCVPFQAADILAWRHARLMKDLTKVESGGTRPRREFFPALFRQLPHDSCGFYDRTVLHGYCEKQGYTKRT
jgi:hypothetical protein